MIKKSGHKMEGSAGQSFVPPIKDLTKICKPVRVVLIPLELQDNDFKQIEDSVLEEERNKSFDSELGNKKRTLSKTKQEKNKKSKTVEHKMDGLTEQSFVPPIKELAKLRKPERVKLIPMDLQDNDEEYVECKLNNLERRIIELIEANNFEDYDLAIEEDSDMPTNLTFDSDISYTDSGSNSTTRSFEIEGMKINRKFFLKQCRYCEAKFNRPENLKNHERTHDEYESQDELKNPRRNIKKPSKFCTQCNATFDGPKSIRKHELFHKEGVKYTCQPCRFGFETRKTYVFHEQTKHNDVEKYVCKFCGVRFKIQRVWKTHLRIHATNRRFSCEKCGAVFTSQNNLNRHLIIHKNSKEYPCDICGHSFSTLYACRVHKSRYHPRDKEAMSEELKCKVCGKCFTRASYLKLHNAIHAGDTPHKCQYCPKRFASQPLLNRHFVSAHGGDSVKVQCEHCGKLCKHKESLAYHVKYQHSVVGDLRVVCDMCGKMIPKRRLTIHKKRHQEKTLECSQCSFITNTPFSLKEHQYVHSKEKRYSCTSCPASYRSWITLKKHKLTHNVYENNDYNSATQN